VRSTTFLFTSWCTSIQIFGVSSTRIGLQWHGFRPAEDMPRRHAPRRATLTSQFGPRIDRVTAPSRGVACTEATLEVRAATWSFRVRRRPHPRLNPGPFAPSPSQACRPRSWTSRPPRQPWARTREAATPINRASARWLKGAASHRAS
jgi:hypothetical protein